MPAAVVDVSWGVESRIVAPSTTALSEVGWADGPHRASSTSKGRPGRAPTAAEGHNPGSHVSCCYVFASVQRHSTPSVKEARR